MEVSGASYAGLARTDGGRLSTDQFWIDEEHPQPRTVVLALHGEADLHVAGKLRDQLGEVIEENPALVVLDLSDATFLDSTAIAALLHGMKRVRARGGRFRVVVPRSQIRRIFEMTLLDRVFDLDASRQESLAVAANGDGRTARARP
jgi:anti-sigma B factor antagonist